MTNSAQTRNDQEAPVLAADQQETVSPERARKRANHAILRSGSRTAGLSSDDLAEGKISASPVKHPDHPAGQDRSAQSDGGPTSPAGRGGVAKPGTRSKAQIVLGLLRRKRGASIDEMMAATGWQAHSVRSFLSATIGKRMGLALVSGPDKAGVRRYRIVEEAVTSRD